MRADLLLLRWRDPLAAKCVGGGENHLTNKWFNPLLRKELRQRMRSGRTILALSLYLLSIGVVAFVYMYVNVQGQTLILQPARTAELFTFLSYLQLALVSFVTPGIASGVISGERERQTLSVLLTTPLSPVTIIFTKFISSISFLLLLIVMTLPLYSIVFLFGGVQPSQVMAVFGMQVITLGAIAGISIFFSTLLRRTGWSTVFSYATVALLFLGLAVFGYLFDSIGLHNPEESLWQRLAGICFALDPIYVQAGIESSLGLLSPVINQSLVASVFSVVSAHSLMKPAAWLFFFMIYIASGVLLLLVSAWRLRPGGFTALRKRIVRWIAQ